LDNLSLDEDENRPAALLAAYAPLDQGDSSTPVPCQPSDLPQVSSGDQGDIDGPILGKELGDIESQFWDETGAALPSGDDDALNALADDSICPQLGISFLVQRDDLS
jgi:hypothetical protein